jgi:Na+:H+ antiporter, NhaA family
MKITKLFLHFFESEKAGGLILVIVTLLSLVLANSFIGEHYIEFWQIKLGSHTLVEWINDGLMTIFFLMIGLELEREVYIGELSDFKNASLPLFGALGGMAVPALIYLWLNWGTPTQDGAGIPMATDIAFAVGILSLLGNRVPLTLKIFLTALAVIDDLGAIIIIAVFYTKEISYFHLGIAMGIWVFLFVLNRLKVYNLIPYLIGGVIMWIYMLNSGVHATITGVILAFVIPFGDGSEKSISYRLESFLHAPVAFGILPLFAIANTALLIAPNWQAGLLTSASLGIILGLVVGKPLGIWSFSIVAAKMRFCVLPNGLKYKHLLGAGFLGGIGFTMSIFITLLAFDRVHLGDQYLQVVDEAKMAILLASLAAGVTGFLILKKTLPKIAPPEVFEELPQFEHE